MANFTVRGQSGKEITVECDYDSFLLQFYGSDEQPMEENGVYIVDDETIESTIKEYPEILR